MVFEDCLCRGKGKGVWENHLIRITKYAATRTRWQRCRARARELCRGEPRPLAAVRESASGRGRGTENSCLARKCCSSLAKMFERWRSDCRAEVERATCNTQFAQSLSFRIIEIQLEFSRNSARKVKQGKAPKLSKGRQMKMKRMRRDQEMCWETKKWAKFTTENAIIKC